MRERPNASAARNAAGISGTPGKPDSPVLSLGADVGSTTAKLALMRGEEILYTTYERHFSRIRETLVDMLRSAESVLGDETFTAAISGVHFSKV